MYDEIGKKLKDLATLSCIIGLIASIIIGLLVMIIVDNTIFIVVGLIIMLVGCFISWVSSSLLYGFGELIDKTCDIQHNTRQLISTTYKKHHNSSESQNQNIVNSQDIDTTVTSSIDPERLKKLIALRDQGLITEEEYQNAITKNNG